MPRLACLDAPGVLHHIIIRGIEHRKIFGDDQDKDNLIKFINSFAGNPDFLLCLGVDVKHAHFLFRSGNAGISTLLMRRLLTGRKVQVEARDLLCYWAVQELGMSCTDVAKRLGMSQPGVGYAVSRGEKIAKKHKYQLPE